MKRKQLILQDLLIVWYVVAMYTNHLSGIISVRKYDRIKTLSSFENFRYQNNRNLNRNDFLQKLKKVVRDMLYRPAISQSDRRKAGPYQLPLINQSNVWKPGLYELVI